MTQRRLEHSRTLDSRLRTGVYLAAVVDDNFAYFSGVDGEEQRAQDRALRRLRYTKSHLKHVELYTS